MKVVDGRIQIAASDEANFVSCSHLTCLDLLHAKGELKVPVEYDLGFADLVQRGMDHEAEVLEGFRSQGRSVLALSSDPDSRGVFHKATVDALRSGVDVIYQGVLLDEASSGQLLLGRPDFLIRADLLPAPDGEPRGGAAHYEVVDAKLARIAKARAVLQGAFYSGLLARALGLEPRWMHLALGNGELSSFKVKDFAAYERQVRRLLVAFLAEDHGGYPVCDPYPEAVEHCTICRWRHTCAARRRDDDDLSLVAGITQRQRQELKAVGVATRAGLGGLNEPPDLSRVSEASLQRLRQQARLQVASEAEGEIAYEMLDPERDDEGSFVPNRGLLALPEPVVGDLFFDIEGSRYYSEDGKEFGLQYLFGVVDTGDTGEDGRPRYVQLWSFDRKEEKRSFEELIDLIERRRTEHPGLHVYHYSHYEPASVDHLSELHETRTEAVGRLMGRYATREDQVDDLFRLGIFVDLYRVVRQGLRVGVESYSIKRLEPLCGYERRVELTDATRQLIAFEAALEDHSASRSSESATVVAGYNEDDCRATLALRDWLEERRGDLAARCREELPRPAAREEPLTTEDPEVARVKAALMSDVPEETSARTPEQAARALLADLLEWHRRDAKPAWWRYFHVRTLNDTELLSEPDAIGGLIGGAFVDEVKQSIVRRFTFHPQEHRFSTGDRAYDPVTGRQWTIQALDDHHGTIDLKIGRTYSGQLPRALVEDAPIRTDVLSGALLALGQRVAAEGLHLKDPAMALLLRRRPLGEGVGTDPLRLPEESASEAAVRLAVALDDSYLPVQGPPGTGKTFAGAEQILALVRTGRTVGITGPSHAVIHNLIEKVVSRAAERGEQLRIGQRAEGTNPFLHPEAAPMDYKELEDGLREGRIQVAAGTGWLWSREQFAGAVDTLFVDEAGQMSLATVLAMSRAGTNLVLLGDPQQLAQPSQGVHPPGAGVSALEHVLGDRATLASDAGLFMDRTWRMHPDLCSYTSDVFYDGRLRWQKGLENQAILGEGQFRGSGIRVIEVDHVGSANCSPEEAQEVVRILRQLLGQRWRDSDGSESHLAVSDLLVVTPYNAQIRYIDEAVEAARMTGVQIGTVDRFQGREAPVVIYSMATSSAADAPRGMEFLYDPHRLNVATSRAKGMAIIVASPEIPRVSCRTPRQMLLANAVCRAWESGS